MSQIESVYPHTTATFENLEKNNSEKFKSLFIEFLNSVGDLVNEFDDLDFRLTHCVRLQQILKNLKNTSKCPTNRWHKECLKKIVEPIQSIIISRPAEEMTLRDKEIISNLLKRKIVLELKK
jgi:hypothetical protein